MHKIPGALEDMLVRGAYLEHSARELEHSRREQAVRLETVKATQPPFLFLRPKETRVAFKVASRDTSEDLTALDKALAINKNLSDHLRTRSEELLEKWLRTHCEEYRLGLAAGHFSVDWEQSLMRFTEHAHMFIQALGSARNMAPAGYDRVRGVFSPSTYEAISNAHAAALRVEGEIVATNAIAEEHDKLLGKTVFNDPMPRLVQEPYAAVVAQIASLPPVAAQTEFTRVITAVEDLITRELDALRARVRDAAQEHAGRTHSYVRDAWNQLHAHAVAHSVDVEHIGAVVEQTERTYLVDSSFAMA
ncbi:hypothetical protein [Rariglobus hedericola]|uniref:Uncharacterized protein n=1 Tax=Rariglobus hedericola TaxID=2597822 RepID=A0A556QR90_9BACT|nr:hypothetical protein [Rariglobus hedericola]TSJ79142.1 hypothetical protein FPL22_07565 [Rariglobus hedericola]